MHLSSRRPARTGAECPGRHTGGLSQASGARASAVISTLVISSSRSEPFAERDGSAAAKGEATRRSAPAPRPPRDPDRCRPRAPAPTPGRSDRQVQRRAAATPAASVNDIATAAAVSKKTFYDIFESKEACLLAAHGDYRQRLLKAIDEGYATGDSWPQGSRSAVRGALTFLAADLAGTELLATGVLCTGAEGARRHYETIDAIAARLRHAARGTQRRLSARRVGCRRGDVGDGRPGRQPRRARRGPRPRGRPQRHASRPHQSGCLTAHLADENRDHLRRLDPTDPGNRIERHRGVGLDQGRGDCDRRDRIPATNTSSTSMAPLSRSWSSSATGIAICAPTLSRHRQQDPLAAVLSLLEPFCLTPPVTGDRVARPIASAGASRVVARCCFTPLFTILLYTEQYTVMPPAVSIPVVTSY